MRPHAPLAALAVSLGIAGWMGLQDREGRVLDPKLHHLGNDKTPDWREASPEPEGKRLDVRFESAANAEPWTLYVRQRSVDEVWRLKVNGAEVARLTTGAALVERFYELPARSLEHGENLIEIVPDVPTDDVVVGELRLVEMPLRELFDLRPLTIRVTDSANGKLLPARVTLVDGQGRRPPVFFPQPDAVAVRDGVIYVGAVEARVEVPAGSYTCYAARGPEWSLFEEPLVVAADRLARVDPSLKRELDTAGFVACDTHLHTLEFSGHGDASVAERIVTLAAEGVELAVATDHNHHTDYRPTQKQLGLEGQYTAITGNEVTTEVGHFNGFPLDPRGAIAEHKLTDYPKIVEGIRARGAAVVILNHPRWPNPEKGPFGVHGLDHLLGRFDPPLELTVDATEMINSTVDTKDPYLLFSDWFALLNRGVRIFAVGSSDSHTVDDPVGQGRTWIPSKTDDPSAIDVAAACDAIKNGRTSFGMGIFATIVVGGRATMGATLDRSHDDAPIEIELRVQAPSWIRPRTATLFVDGVAADVREIASEPGRATDARLQFSAPLATRNDAWIVAVVLGDAVTTPAWPCLNPYTLAGTNPVFVDRDGGSFASARTSAEAFLSGKFDEAALARRVAEVDEIHAVHLLDAWCERMRSDAVDRKTIGARATAAAGALATSSKLVAELLARF
jgi:hypothetical protein